MAYDEALAARVRDALGKTKGLTELKMFGGVGFMVNGNMALGVSKEDLIVRVGPDGHAKALDQPGARAFDFGGRTMVGMLVVGPAGTKKPKDLAGWVAKALSFVATLPPKKKKKK